MTRRRPGLWAGAAWCTALVVLTSILNFAPSAEAQRSRYLYERVGSSADAQADTSGGLVLMGGGPDVDVAFEWFKDRANGGDIVVIRADRIGGYNPYILSETGGVQPNSVATIGFTSRWQDRASDVQFITDTLNNAEGIFIAGGDQSDYDRYWRGTVVEDILNQKAADGVPIGGTSAGLAILGSSAYVALGSSVTSGETMSNPYDNDITLEHDFLDMPYLDGVITDSHFSERDRHGRLATFMARMLADGVEEQAVGLGIDEETALLIDEDGLASVVSWDNGHAYVFNSGAPTHGVQAGDPLDFGPISVTRLGVGDTFDFNEYRHTGGDTFSYSVINGQLVSGSAVALPEPGAVGAALAASGAWVARRRR
ncbi:MAG: cyanophycinase [Planctomycetota bacterium]